MTTILQARDELAAALVAGGIPIGDAPGSTAPPSGMIFGEGIAGDAHAMRGQARASFRATLIAGGWETAVAGRTLTGMVQTAVGVIKAMDGWQLGNVGRDTIIAISGGQMLGCDVIASRFIDI